MTKVWTDYDLHLYPYLSKIKLLALIDDGIKQTHFYNIDNVINSFNAFVSGTKAFPEREDKKEPWHADLNSKLEQYQAAQKPALLAQVLSAGKEVSSLLSYMNFEQMVTHCMEQDDTRVCMSKKLIGIVMSAILAQSKAIAL